MTMWGRLMGARDLGVVRLLSSGIDMPIMFCTGGGEDIGGAGVRVVFDDCNTLALPLAKLSTGYDSIAIRNNTTSMPNQAV